MLTNPLRTFNIVTCGPLGFTQVEVEFGFFIAGNTQADTVLERIVCVLLDTQFCATQKPADSRLELCDQKPVEYP